jgi:hypothetical protein
LHKELLARVVVSGVECTNYKILTRYMSSFCSRGGLTKREMALPVSSWRLLHMEANTRTKLISRLPIHIFKDAGNITVRGTYEFSRTTSNCFMTPYRGDRQHCRRGLRLRDESKSYLIKCCLPVDYLLFRSLLL